MTPDEVKKAVESKLRTAAARSLYKPKCTEVWLECNEPKIWGAYIQYYPEGSDIPIDGPTFEFVDDASGEFVDRPAK